MRGTDKLATFVCRFSENPGRLKLGASVDFYMDGFTFCIYVKLRTHMRSSLFVGCYAPLNILEDQMPQIHDGGSLKPRLLIYLFKTDE